MQVFIFILIILVCIFLALIVLIQNPKGGGLDSSFSSANQIGGVKRTADFLEKGTWTLGVALFVLCLISSGLADQVPMGSTSPFRENPAPLMQSAPAEQAPIQQDADQSGDENTGDFPLGE